MIPLRVGSLLLLRNAATFEGTYCEIREVVNVGDHRIVYGELRPYQTRIYRGGQEWGGRPTAFPVVNTAKDGKLGLAALSACIHETEGAGGVLVPVAPFGRWRVSLPEPGASLVEQARKGPAPGVIEYPLYCLGRPMAAEWRGTPYLETWHPECRGWGGNCPRSEHMPNRGGMIECYRKAIALYEDLLATGSLPGWFIEDRSAARRRANTPLVPDAEKSAGPLYLGGGAS